MATKMIRDYVSENTGEELPADLVKMLRPKKLNRKIYKRFSDYLLENGKQEESDKLLRLARMNEPISRKRPAPLTQAMATASTMDNLIKQETINDAIEDGIQDAVETHVENIIKDNDLDKVKDMIGKVSARMEHLTNVMEMMFKQEVNPTKKSYEDRPMKPVSGAERFAMRFMRR